MNSTLKTILLFALFYLVFFCPQAFGADQMDAETLAQDNAAFALDLYKELCQSDGNLFFSPSSISTALSMTYAGARGNTKAEMTKTLRFSLNPNHIYAAFQMIDMTLNNIQDTGQVKLNVANSLWPQKGYTLMEAYMDLIQKYYGPSIMPVDYKRDHEAARHKINAWVENKTQDKIKDLIQPGVLNALTRLVLVNAIYFKGSWEKAFEFERTREAPFFNAHDTSIQVPTMNRQARFNYGDFEDCQMIELPYGGNDLAMLIVLPKKKVGLKQIENDLTLEKLNHWQDALHKQEVVVYLPKFKMTSMFRLDQTLKALGMVDAFNGAKADFSGMDGRPKGGLFIGGVIHKAFVEVNEEGTEAAAATAVVMRATSVRRSLPVIRINRPFIFFIRERETGSILFMGRIEDPSV